MSTYLASGTAVPGLLWLGPPAASTDFGTAIVYVGYGAVGTFALFVVGFAIVAIRAIKGHRGGGGGPPDMFPDDGPTSPPQPPVARPSRQTRVPLSGLRHQPTRRRTRRPEAPPGGSNRSLFRRAEPTLGDEHPTERTSTMIRTLISESSGPDGPPPTIVLDQS